MAVRHFRRILRWFGDRLMAERQRQSTPRRHRWRHLRVPGRVAIVLVASGKRSRRRWSASGPGPTLLRFVHMPSRELSPCWLLSEHTGGICDASAMWLRMCMLYTVWPKSSSWGTVVLGMGMANCLRRPCIVVGPHMLVSSGYPARSRFIVRVAQSALWFPFGCVPVELDGERKIVYRTMFSGGGGDLRCPQI